MSLETIWLLGLGKVIREPFLVGYILEPRLRLGLRMKFLCTEFFLSRGGRQACQSLGNGKRKMGERWLAKNSQG